MAMRFVYHYTKDGFLLGPGTMFVFASCLLVVASGCAFALPKDKADSRRRLSNTDNTEDDVSALFVDAATPLFESSSRDSDNSALSYGGTEML